jgi:dihydrofolate reductase
MSAARQIEGFAIVSADGHIADHNGHMPDILKNDEDLRFFDAALEHADVLVHGRHSHEGHQSSERRRRLILTRRVAALAPNPDFPNAMFWNPAGATFEAACDALGVAGGFVAVLGGPEVYSLFLDMGYDRFHLSRSRYVSLPGGLPVFAHGRYGGSAEEALRRAGLVPGPERTLDEANGVTVVDWRRMAS